MIRLIRRRLIIPQGDTGPFTIPTQGTVSEGDIATFAIYDRLTHKTVLEKRIPATDETLTFVFAREDTINIEPEGDYVWDIVIERSPVYDEENHVVAAASTDSYYAAFKLPICEIRRVPREIH